MPKAVKDASWIQSLIPLLWRDISIAATLTAFPDPVVQQFRLTEGLNTPGIELRRLRSAAALRMVWVLVRNQHNFCPANAMFHFGLVYDDISRVGMIFTDPIDLVAGPDSIFLEPWDEETAPPPKRKRKRWLRLVA